MAGWWVLTIFLWLYGLLCASVGLLTFPKAVWNMGKIEGFKKIMGVIGTRIFLTVWGLAALAGGILLLIYKIL